MIDLCVGPHIPHTGRVKSLAVLKNSSSYFLGDANNESLQRIYGISFPDNNQMKEYKKFLEEAAKRDHRRIGKVCRIFKAFSRIWILTLSSVLCRIKNSSSSTISRPVPLSGYHTAPASTTRSSSSCE